MPMPTRTVLIGDEMWGWLQDQPGGSGVTIRHLVDEAMRAAAEPPVKTIEALNEEAAEAEAKVAEIKKARDRLEGAEKRVAEEKALTIEEEKAVQKGFIDETRIWQEWCAAHPEFTKIDPRESFVVQQARWKAKKAEVVAEAMGAV